MPGEGETNEQATTSDSIALLLEGMRQMQEELKVVRQGQEETSQRIAIQSHKDSYSFKKKGNECQFKANQQVTDRLAVVASCLDRVEAIGTSGKEQLERARKEVVEGMSFLARRQKLIKLADRSESGWAVIEDYDADALADNSEDERKIEKAEKAAERKLAKRRKAQDVKHKAGIARSDAAETIRQTLPVLQPKIPSAEAKAGGSGMARARFPVGSCFRCGDPGHFQTECPKMASPRAEYPLISGVEHVDMEGVDGGDVSPYMWGSGENVLPEEDKCISNTYRCWEAQEGDDGIGSVRGRLGACISYWEKVLCAPPWVLETLRNGYVLPFYSEPAPYARPNQHSAQVEVEFVSKAVAELLNGGYIEKVSELPVVCSPLSVVTNGVGKKRLVVNLRHVNRSLWKQKFKYEDLRVAMMMFKQGEWMFSFDLKAGYHHVDVAKCHRKYLGFEWGGSFYTFVVLPFGLSSAPYVFTKMMRPLVRLWRSKGLKAVVYLDDGIVAVPDETGAITASGFVRDTLYKAGWVCNEAKSTWVPTHRLSWLGFTMDLGLG